jgi:Tol biopolymer transport system component/DNA-binding winged helix-turn-helix (wHTH) protein
MPADVLRFGDGLELDRGAYELRRSGRSLKLERIPMEILLLLVERRGQLVSREDIIARIWGKDVHLDTDNSINAAMRKIRQVLKDNPEQPLFVQTVTGKGYRFIAQVGMVVEGADDPGFEDSSRGNGRSRHSPDGDGQSAFPLEGGTMIGRTMIASATNPEPTRQDAIASPGSGQAAGTALPPCQEQLQVPRAKRRISLRLLGAVIFCSLVALIAYRFRPASPAPHVKGIRQITHVGTVVPNENLVATDSRVYFVDTENGEHQLRSVSLDGETVFPVEKPFRTTAFFDVSPSGSELLIGEVVRQFPPTNWRRALWRLPVPDGVPRRVGDLFADDAAWSPDSRTIAYTTEYDQSVNLADGDGGNIRRLASFPGSPFKPRWSPDGKLIRISVTDQAGPGISLWQVDASGHNVTRMLPDWSSAGRAWAGRWSRDGRYFLFTGFQGGRKNIWAISDKRDFFRRGGAQPVQLTDGPLDFYLPTLSNDGKKIYAVGTQSHGQLMQLNGSSHQFEPYLDSLSADHVAFSPDGKWMAYIAYPECTLVRSRLDGSERLQLTFAPMRAYRPRWSPDGSQIAFEGTANVDALQKVYVVSANGGSPHLAVPGASAEQKVSDWSSDGESLLFGSSDRSGSAWSLRRLNLKTGTETVLPGSLGIGEGRLSPDGRYMAVLSLTGGLLVYDTVSGTTTRQLADFADYPAWSPDGKYVYYSNISRGFILTPEKTGIFRVKIADASIERLVPAPAFPIQGNWGIWFGLTPESSLLVMRNLGTSDIYTLDVELP